jgi:hypothetical protein
MKHAMWGVGLWLALAGMLFAQHHGRVIGGSFGFGHRISPSGFGNILYPGTGGPPSIPNPFYRHPTTFAQRLGATVGGFPGYTIGGKSAYGRGRLGGAVPIVVPYAVPVYTGFGYGYDYGYAPPPSNVTVVSPPQPQPSVIINQYYTPEKANPTMQDYTQTPLPESGDQGMRFYQAPIPSFPEGRRQNEEVSPSEAKATIYLIALKNQAIYPAIAYWVEGDTVHYITPQGTHNQVSFSLVDRDFSEELNRERNIEFKLDLPQ